MVCGILCPSLLLFMNQSNLGVCLGALAWSCIITANLEKKIFYYVFVQRSKFNAQHAVKMCLHCYNSTKILLVMLPSVIVI